MKSNNFFEKWYKSKIEEGNEIPPDDIWKNISKELDIHSVWSNVSAELDIRESKKRRRVAFVYLFSLVGFFFVGAWMFFRNESLMVNSDLITNKNSKAPITTNLTTDPNSVVQKNDKEKLIRKDYRTTDPDTSDRINVSGINVKAYMRRTEASAKNSTASISSMTVPVANIKATLRKDNITTDTSDRINVSGINVKASMRRTEAPAKNSTASVSSMTVPEANITAPLTGITLPAMKIKENLSNSITDSVILYEGITLNEIKTGRDYIKSINLVEKHLYFTDTNLLVQRHSPFDTLANLAKSEEKSNVGRFYAGIVFSVQNPWLMNHYTYNSLLESSINEAVPGIGICYGVSSAYSFTHGWNVNCDLFIQSRYGQAYNSYNNGTYEKEKINLDYKQINLYGVKRKDRQLKNKNLIFSNGPLLGLNVKYLYYASKTINGLKNDAIKQYTKYDFGVLIGYEYSLSLNKDWLFSTSINGDFGLNNIYVGKGHESKASNKTNNASLRWACNIRYLIY